MLKFKGFRKYYNDDFVGRSECGSRYQVDYVLNFNDDGTSDLVECGKIDTYEMIQSHKDSVDLNLIMERYASGDITALERQQGFFADLSQMNLNLADVLNANIAGERLFNELPVSEREKYGNDYNRWLSSNISDSTAHNDAGDIPDEDVREQVEEVKEDE